MSNTTFTSSTSKPAVEQSKASSTLRELFQATPLYIFVTAAKAAFAKR